MSESNRKNSDSGEHFNVCLPDILWSIKPHPLWSVTTKLPRLILHDGSTSISSSGASQVEFLTKPLLAHSVHDVTKVIARNLKVGFNKQGKANFREELANATVVIPIQNKSWFSLLSPNAELRTFNVIDEIPLSNVTSFLVTTPLKAKKMRKSSNNVFDKVSINPGTVLKIIRDKKVGKRKTSIESLIPSINVFKNKSSAACFLQCTDEDMETYFIKTERKGIFHAVRVDGEIVPNECVMQLDDILVRKQFPIDVVKQFGTTPSNIFFTGYVQLRETIRENVLIASTVTYVNNVLLEIPRDNCPMFFKVAHQVATVVDSQAYKNAFNLCENNCSKYVQEIKALSEASFKRRTKSVPTNPGMPKPRHLANEDSKYTSSPRNINNSAYKSSSKDCPNYSTGSLPNYYKTNWFHESSDIPPPVPCRGQRSNSIKEESTEDTIYECDSVIYSENNAEPCIRRPDYNLSEAPKRRRSMVFSFCTPELEVRDSGVSSLHSFSLRDSNISSSSYSTNSPETIVHDTENGRTPHTRSLIYEKMECVNIHNNDDSGYVDMNDSKRKILISSDPVAPLPLKESLPDRVETHEIEGDSKLLESDNEGYENEVMWKEVNVNKSIEEKSVEEITRHLLDCSVERHVVEVFRINSIDGALLVQLDDRDIIDVCPNIKDVDVRKLNMVIRQGWKPRHTPRGKPTNVLPKNTNSL